MLILCATPIGNLEDMTYRAVRTLKEVDLIAAEDTRNSIKLLNHFDIHTPMTSYHEHNKFEKGRELVDKLLSGMDIALITDAGMPGISDPGEELVRMAYEAGVEVTVVPGACACVTALVMSGLPTRRFAFEAFLPTDKKQRAEVLEQLKQEQRTVVLYEAPHRLVKTLAELAEAFGGERQLRVLRELTKKHEARYAGTIAEAVAYYTEHAPKGECVLVLEGVDPKELAAQERSRYEEMSLSEHMDRYLGEGIDRKEAMRLVAKDRGISKRDVYQALLEEESK